MKVVDTFNRTRNLVRHSIFEGNRWFRRKMSPLWSVWQHAIQGHDVPEKESGKREKKAQ